ncbi:MAG: hypothetical protein AB4352_06305 [Hormoscilla sp.]
MQIKEIINKLRDQIETAGAVAPTEAEKLKKIFNWVSREKPGKLTARKYVLLFLKQLILDIEAWLKIQSLSAAEKSEALKGMSPTERYWYSELLPQWLRTYDPKFYKWKRRLMKGEYADADRELIKAILDQISSRQGDGVSRYIADLSMATDIIVSNNQSIPLCVQLTQSADEYTQEKEANWEETLRYWGIERGLFISYNPAIDDYLTQVVNIAKYNSDNIKPAKYQKFRIEKRRKPKNK